MTEKIDWKRIFFIESNWCCGCKHSWKYIAQEPCSKCLYASIGPNKPLYYEKETSDV